MRGGYESRGCPERPARRRASRSRPGMTENALNAPPSRQSSTAPFHLRQKSSAARCTSVASPLPCATATSRSQRRDTAMPTAARRDRPASEIVGPRASRHVGHPDDLARLKRHEPLTHQIEIGDAVDFVVIGDTACRNCRSRSLAARRLRRATAARRTAKRAPRGPTIARKRPARFPASCRHASAAFSYGRTAGQRAERETATAMAASRASFTSSWQTGDGARRPGQFENMQAGIGAIDDVDIAALVGLDIVGLDRDLAAVLAVDA